MYTHTHTHNYTVYHVHVASPQKLTDYILLSQILLSLSLSFSLSLSLSPPSGGIPNMKHVLLLVGSKVLAICGRSPQLPTADLLLLILMTTNLYQHDPFLQGVCMCTYMYMYMIVLNILFLIM